MNYRFTRRHVLTTTGTLLATAASSGVDFKAAQVPAQSNVEPFHYCFNTSTIRGQNLPLPQQIEITARAGYQGIEPWLGHLHEFAETGGSLDDIRKQISDAGMTVESAIGFARWIVDDDTERAQGLKDAERDMRAIKAIGGTRIAAPPVGATGAINLDVIAERYRALLEIGTRLGVIPQLELWGHSPAIHRLGQLIYVATESGHRDACMLPDVYHIFKGGSDFNGLRLIEGKRLHAFHMNDYPAEPGRATIGDQHRVYPGDGIAPLNQILRDLYDTGFRGALSLELFNREYWQQDPLQVAKTGLQKMKQVVKTALNSPG